MVELNQSISKLNPFIGVNYNVTHWSQLLYDLQYNNKIPIYNDTIKIIINKTNLLINTRKNTERYINSKLYELNCNSGNSTNINNTFNDNNTNINSTLSTNINNTFSNGSSCNRIYIHFYDCDISKMNEIYNNIGKVYDTKHIVDTQSLESIIKNIEIHLDIAIIMINNLTIDYMSVNKPDMSRFYSTCDIIKTSNNDNVLVNDKDNLMKLNDKKNISQYLSYFNSTMIATSCPNTRKKYLFVTIKCANEIKAYMNTYINNDK